jgi:hypothetical protein
MTMNEMINSGNVRSSLVPEWARAERYEYCEDFYESYTTGKGNRILTKIASILTSLFI